MALETVYDITPTFTVPLLGHSGSPSVSLAYWWSLQPIYSTDKRIIFNNHRVKKKETTIWEGDQFSMWH